jgi:hypothetical protein
LKDEHLTNIYKNYKVELGQIKYKALQANFSVRRSVNEIKKTTSLSQIEQIQLITHKNKNKGKYNKERAKDARQRAANKEMVFTINHSIQFKQIFILIIILI